MLRLNRELGYVQANGGLHAMRKLIAFDDDTHDKLTQLGRSRMATLQELADEAFADLLKKHGVPIDLKEALRKSAGVANKTAAKSRSKDGKR
jgi:non-homologous end joining protein Ku